MARKQPPREPDNPELGETREQRNRRLRYAHEQYSGSGQGRFGAPKGRNLPLEKPRRQEEDYPPETKMPWPPDDKVAAEARRPGRRRR
jgi:hypothetical protein